MNIASIVLLVVHGLLHLLGFAKAWGLAALPQLSGKALMPLSAAVAKGLGLGWLAAAVTLLVAAALCAARREVWWKVSAIGIVLSQALIIVQWEDAKFGSLANLLIAVAVAAAASRGEERTPHAPGAV